MIMLPDSPPELKRFLTPVGLTDRARMMTIRLIVAFMMHFGRMSASRAGRAIKTDPRHRAQIGRFLARKFWEKRPLLAALQDQLLALESKRDGRFLFLLDQTLCGQQGQMTENTYSTGNRKRRPRKGRRHGKHKHTKKSCHCFVMGLLITPSGVRIPFCKPFYTKAYCQKKQRPFRKQTELAAELIRELPVPEGADVVVLGDTAFDAKTIRQACATRNYPWIVPINPERVLEGLKPRPQVRSILLDLTPEQFQTVRLQPSGGKYVAYRRVASCRLGSKAKTRTYYVHKERRVVHLGSKAKTRTYYVHKERRVVHSVGPVRLVFSTRKSPKTTGTLELQKILITNLQEVAVREIVELYNLRWQIELFFKELKSTLGFHQYSFREFARVERWAEMALATFLYLEWYRARQLQRRNLSEEKKRWWRWQRTHGSCQAIRQATEIADLKYFADRLETPGGIQRLRRIIKRAFQREYQCAA